MASKNQIQNQEGLELSKEELIMLTENTKGVIRAIAGQFDNDMLNRADVVEPNSTIFLSGPMTGIEDFNYPRFNEVAEKLEKLGYTVVNPTQIGINPDWTHKEYLRESINLMANNDIDAIALLDFFQPSTGVGFELHFAEILELPVVYARELTKEGVMLKNAQGEVLFGGVTQPAVIYEVKEDGTGEISQVGELSFLAELFETYLAERPEDEPNLPFQPGKRLASLPVNQPEVDNILQDEDMFYEFIMNRENLFMRVLEEAEIIKIETQE